MASNNLIYGIHDRPKIGKWFLYSFQLLLAILAATIAVPTIIGLPTQIPAAILGAGVGTLVYILFTKGKSPIVISSSFAFLGAFPTAIAFGYMGIFLGGLFAGTVYVIIAIIVKFVGTKWLNKLLPPVVIGPVVALIGLSLAGSAIADFTKSSATGEGYNLIAILVALVTFFIVVVFSVQNKWKGLKLIPFIIGILGGYVVATIFTVIGNATNVAYLQIVNWKPVVDNFSNFTINSIFSVPKISIVEGIKELASGKFDSSIANLGAQSLTGPGVAMIALAFCPIALVSFAEHIADHKNMSRIIGDDLLTNPGLTRTLLGDGVGTIMGTAFGVCPNTSYGEGIACVAMTRNASVWTTSLTAVICIFLSFLAPFSVCLQTIPSCVMGGVCLALYGYISVSGLRMFKDINLDDNKNLFTVCAVLIAGIGGLAILIPIAMENNIITQTVAIGPVATAMILGIVVYQVCGRIEKREKATGVVAETNQDISKEDNFRTYLKQFTPDVLSQGVLTFGFLYENVEFAASTLSTVMRSEEQLGLRTKDELHDVFNLFKFKGEITEKTSKKDLIILIKENIDKIDASIVDASMNITL